MEAGAGIEPANSGFADRLDSGLQRRKIGKPILQRESVVYFGKYWQVVFWVFIRKKWGSSFTHRFSFERYSIEGASWQAWRRAGRLHWCWQPAHQAKIFKK